ncbi:hypothetical protein OH77DRAFT_1420349 [Trametes cingulata]|nr:hypothetical protein OH77DRAFT_1420349 [Trametes cingulata]
MAVPGTSLKGHSFATQPTEKSSQDTAVLPYRDSALPEWLRWRASGGLAGDDSDVPLLHYGFIVPNYIPVLKSQAEVLQLYTELERDMEAGIRNGDEDAGPMLTLSLWSNMVNYIERRCRYRVHISRARLAAIHQGPGPENAIVVYLYSNDSTSEERMAISQYASQAGQVIKEAFALSEDAEPMWYYDREDWCRRLGSSVN